MSAKHTPGPWEVAPHSDVDEVLNVVSGYREIDTPSGRIQRAHWIAECDAALDLEGGDGDAERDENAANARLIAAAPELLDLVRAYSGTVEPVTLAKLDKLAHALLARIDGEVTR